MIDYRGIRKDEVQVAIDFCKENGLEFPLPYEVVFGAFDDGVLVGLCALKKVYQIEPLIANVKYGGITQILAEKVIACASLVTREVTALVKDSKNVELFKRYGFTVRDESITSISKDI
jgi:hypothetical protein